MQLLSSRATFFSKFAGPGMPIALLPVWWSQIPRDNALIFPALFWTAMCAFVVWWYLPVKKVALENGVFFISNYRTEITVPASQLVQVKENRSNRTPNLELVFNPPTAFGAKIRIIPPIEFFGHAEFDEAARTLRDILSCNEQQKLRENLDR